MNLNQITDYPKRSKTIETRYQTAQSIVQGLRNQSVVQNDNLEVRWISQSSCFWYTKRCQLDRNSSKSNDLLGRAGRESAVMGLEYRLVNVEEQSNRLAFDHHQLAHALSRASRQEVDVRALLLSDVDIALSPLVVEFSAFSQRWRFTSDGGCCAIEPGPLPLAATELRSPDGHYIAFTRNHNLWVREISTGKETALTHDGREFNCYGMRSSAVGIGFPGINALWSPDSRRLFSLQRDSRRVKSTPVVNHVPENGQIRPTVKFAKVAYPGDKDLEEYRLLCIHVAEARIVEIDYPKLVVGSDDSGFFLVERRAWWSSDNRRAYFIAYKDDGYQVLRVVEFDTDTGNTRILLEERSETYVNLRPEYCDRPLHRYLPDTNELIWWSQRSDYGHLYLYDMTSGELKRPITQGSLVVRNILNIDAECRELLIQTAGRVAGRNPYYRDICRVHIDTGDLTPLLSSDHEYCVNSALDTSISGCSGISPDGRYIVATRSRVDQAPVHLLLNREGEVCFELESASLACLPKGWQWPEPVQVKAADQKTDLYGVLFRPSHFTEERQYPVINMIVSGPWLCAVPHGSFHNSRGYADRHYFHGAALAELGFIVVVLETRGTPLRSKTFQETSYGWIPDGANTADHRAAIEQLETRYPQMDLGRIGIYAPTGYHGAIQNLLECPGFYQVGVINNYMDTRLASRTVEHADKYQGVDGPSEDKLFAEQLVENWRGKLLLLQAMSGILSTAYPPAGAFRLIEAMQRANKDVDLVVTPRVGPGEMLILTPYAQRRAWDYLVEHLLGEQPPESFELGEVPF